MKHKMGRIFFFSKGGCCSCLQSTLLLKKAKNLSLITNTSLHIVEVWVRLRKPFPSSVDTERVRLCVWASLYRSGSYEHALFQCVTYLYICMPNITRTPHCWWLLITVDHKCVCECLRIWRIGIAPIHSYLDWNFASEHVVECVVGYRGNKNTNRNSIDKMRMLCQDTHFKIMSMRYD